MRKEVGTSVLVFGFFFMLFLLFLTFKPGLESTTGRATGDSQQIFNVTQVVMEKVIRNPDGSIKTTNKEPFVLGEEIGCQIDFVGTGKIDVSFLAQGQEVSSPTKKFEDLINKADNQSTICEANASGGVCVAIYKPTEIKLGKWNCLGTFNGINLGSTAGQGVEMIEPFVQSNETFSNQTAGNQTQAIVCNPLWDCQWSECVEGTQTCAYFDRNACNDETSKPQDLTNTCTVDVGQQVTQQRPTPTAKVDVKEKSNTILILVIIAVIGVLGSGAFLAFLLIKKKKAQKLAEEQKKKQEEQAKQQPAQQAAKTAQQNQPQNNALQNYADNALQQGQSPQQIKTDLEKAGWNKQDIEKAVNYGIVKKFVKEKSQQGFPKDKIKETLKAKGWKDEMIEGAFKELNI